MLRRTRNLGLAVSAWALLIPTLGAAQDNSAAGRADFIEDLAGVRHVDCTAARNQMKQLEDQLANIPARPISPPWEGYDESRAYQDLYSAQRSASWASSNAYGKFMEEQFRLEAQRHYQRLSPGEADKLMHQYVDPVEAESKKYIAAAQARLDAAHTRAEAARENVRRYDTDATGFGQQRKNLENQLAAARAAYDDCKQREAEEFREDVTPRSELVRFLQALAMMKNEEEQEKLLQQQRRQQMAQRLKGLSPLNAPTTKSDENVEKTLIKQPASPPLDDTKKTDNTSEKPVDKTVDTIEEPGTKKLTPTQRESLRRIRERLRKPREGHDPEASAVAAAAVGVLIGAAIRGATKRSGGGSQPSGPTGGAPATPPGGGCTSGACAPKR